MAQLDRAIITIPQCVMGVLLTYGLFSKSKNSLNYVNTNRPL